MTKEDMIPLGQPGNEAYDATIRAKLKGSGSQKRVFAQQVRRTREKMEKGLYKEEDIEMLVADPNASAVKIMGLISDMLKQKDLNNGHKIQLIAQLISSHTAIHGIKSKNLNINLNKSIGDNVVERLAQYKTSVAEHGEKEANQIAVTRFIKDRDKDKTESDKRIKEARQCADL